MQTGWLAKAGAYTCEHIPCPDYAGTVPSSVPAKGVLHTTEGSTIEGALAVFQQHYAPHFVVGYDKNRKVRVIQCLPLGRAGAALEHPAGTPSTNGVVRAQIELVGFSQDKPWTPDRPVLVALAALVRELSDVAGIPLRYVANPQRDQKVWDRNGGWFGHADVPNNHHWDPGQIQWEALFAACQTIKAPAKVSVKPKAVLPLSSTWRLRRRANGIVYAEPLERPT